MLRNKTDRTRFSCLVRHPAEKRSRSILTTPEPAWGLLHLWFGSLVFNGTFSTNRLHCAIRVRSICCV